MSADRYPPSALWKHFVAWPVAVLTGYWGFVVLFADILTGLPLWAKAVIVGITHAVPAALIGFLLPRRWYFALVAAWGGVFWGFLFPAVMFLLIDKWPGNNIPVWISLGVVISVVCLGALAGKQAVKLLEG